MGPQQTSTKNIVTMKNARKLKTKRLRGCKSSLYKSIRPIVYVLRIFGLAHYEFDENGKLVPSPVQMMLSFFWICIYTYNIHSILKRLSVVKWDPAVLGQVEMGKAALNYFTAVTDIIVGLIIRKHVSKIWNSLEDFDEQAGKICLIRNTKQTRFWVWSVIVFNAGVWVIINRLGMKAYSEPFFQNFSYMVIYTGSAASVTKFCGLVMVLGQRFQNLKEIIKRSPPFGSKWDSTTRPPGPEYLIEDLYNDLMIIGDNVRSLFSWSILLWISNLSFHIVSNIYYIASTLTGSISDLYRIDFYCQLTWFTTFFWQLWLINYSCHYTSNEANSMSFIMLDWKRSACTRYDNNDIAPLLNFVHRKLAFTAGGCFDINLPRMCSILSLMTTTIVILLQI